MAMFWCTADVGWITKHSYIVYGPLANGATTLMFEGVQPTRIPRVLVVSLKHKVNQFYTAPTAVRSLMVKGEDVLVIRICRHYVFSDRLVSQLTQRPGGYHRVFGRGMSDRGYLVADRNRGIMIVPLPGATAAKPGSAARPFFGSTALVDNEAIFSKARPTVTS